MATQPASFASTASRSSVSSKAHVRAYLSPTLVFLAFDWEEGKDHEDFLGFAIRRTPDFEGKNTFAYLYNKVTFDSPAQGAKPVRSDEAPFQKFHWWDGGIRDTDRGGVLTYEVIPVLGSGKADLKLQNQCASSVTVTIPHVVEHSIGTYFNRAVVSSQSFTSQFGQKPTGKKLDAAMTWLANGMERAIPEFLKDQNDLEWAVYHLTDEEWVLPALKGFSGSASIVYYLKEPPKNSKAKNPSSDTINLETIKQLKSQRFSFHPRTKTSIMHDKFIVRKLGGVSTAVLMGSANFTPEGLTEQANLIHTFESKALAEFYAKRQELISHDPSKKDTAAAATWSPIITIGDAKVRVFFPPEPDHGKKNKQPGASMQTVVDAIRGAKKSAIFCLFDPTDPTMLRSLFDLGDKHKMLFGLVNSISDGSREKSKGKTPEEALRQPSESAKVKVELYHRSEKDHLIVSYDLFNAAAAPRGWLPEFSAIDLTSKSVGKAPVIQPATKGKKAKKRFIPSVHIHHKFIVIDGETDNPTIFSGSANMSNNSVFNNDENLLEITGCPRLAQTYVAEFMRLYEHYRARALWDKTHGGRKATKPKAVGADATFILKTRMKDWVKDAYAPNSPSYIMRVNLASPMTRSATA
jgi:phosphatidylserine/phosphatidylglycerophosphate/cardiolipin synthase-like enzyme